MFFNSTAGPSADGLDRIAEFAGHLPRLWKRLRRWVFQGRVRARVRSLRQLVGAQRAGLGDRSRLGIGSDSSCEGPACHEASQTPRVFSGAGPRPSLFAAYERGPG